MAVTITKKSLNAPDETAKPAANVTAETVALGDLKFQRVTVQPGWRWSKDLKPVVKTDSCQKDHLIYVISGRLGARMNDGKDEEFGPGDVAAIPPGHDGWNSGNEPAVWLEIPH
ncbi:MAG: cupin domain-containing protein [Patescibacteria group bacterium]